MAAGVGGPADAVHTSPVIVESRHRCAGHSHVQYDHLEIHKQQCQQRVHSDSTSLTITTELVTCLKSHPLWAYDSTCLTIAELQTQNYSRLTASELGTSLQTHHCWARDLPLDSPPLHSGLVSGLARDLPLVHHRWAGDLASISSLPSLWLLPVSALLSEGLTLCLSAAELETCLESHHHWARDLPWVHHHRDRDLAWVSPLLSPGLTSTPTTELRTRLEWLLSEGFTGSLTTAELELEPHCSLARDSPPLSPLLSKELSSILNTAELRTHLESHYCWARTRVSLLFSHKLSFNLTTAQPGTKFQSHHWSLRTCLNLATFKLRTPFELPHWWATDLFLVSQPMDQGLPASTIITELWTHLESHYCWART